MALTILGVVSVTGLAAIRAELDTTNRTTRAVEAAALAQNQLAKLKLLPARELATLPDSLRRGGFQPPHAGYRWSATAADVRGERDLYEITIGIEWDDGEFQLVSRVHRPMRGSSGP